MNEPTINKYWPRHSAHEAGITLLDVLLAIVIFVVGMLALASLQGNLTRSSSDSNMRTVAANIAEETIEGMRAFEVIASEAGKIAYADIVDSTDTVQRGGVDYTITVDVDDYYFLADRVSVTTTPPAGATSSSFKHVDLAVTWNTGIEFQVDQDTSTSGRLGSGSITLASIIPSIPSLNNAKVAAEDDGALGYPPVDYTPGLNPDIVAIQLGEQKFKESTTPLPIVRRADELVETWFDIITYTGTKTNEGVVDATFLRREEFVSISCECTLNAAAEEAGRQPTLWDGAEYVEGAKVEKQFGVSATNQQSQYCDVCCNDHHDTASGPESYRPNDTFDTNHPHYDLSNKGELKLADEGDTYFEACRLVRKDGFFRVAQDFDLQNQIALPEDYLDDADEVSDYSEYVTQAVEDHFFSSTDWIHSLDFEGNAPDNRTLLESTDRQYRSRGVYTDLVNSALQTNLDNCFEDDGTPSLDEPLCTVTEASSPIEILPFFDVQLTQLARWTEEPQADPVDVSNEELSNNGYSRGLAALAGDEDGDSDVESAIETGNVGLVSIQPIREEADTDYSAAPLWVQAGEGGATGTPGANVDGTLTNAKQTGNAVASVEGLFANCTRPTNSTFVCVVDLFPVGTPTIMISNYYRANTNLIACTDGLTYVTHVNGSSLDTNYTVYELPTTNTSGIDITIVQGTSCP